MKLAVVLLNMGGPDSLEAIKPFLNNLFEDPDIFKIPFGQKLFAKLISTLRAPGVEKQYKLIGGKSPQNMHTETQRELLQNSLRSNGIDADVIIAMRYWKPLTVEAVRVIETGKYDKVILLPLYPHYSSVTTGSSINEWWRKYSGEKKLITIIDSFFSGDDYIKAINLRINDAIKALGETKNNVHILFSAHSVPQSLINAGDPYQQQILETIRLVMQQRKEKNQYSVSYQSKVGPVKWLEPSTKEKIAELGNEGIKNLIVVPISFVSDHIETLYELGIEYKLIAEENGIINYIVTKGLNDSPVFISQLYKLVTKEL